MPRVQLNVWVEEAQRDAIKALAAERGVPVGRLVAEAVLGAAESLDAVLEARVASLESRAAEVLERVAGVESLSDGFERRLKRFEEMAHGGY